MGSAVVVESGGLLLTVNYVVMGARRVRVTMTDGRRLDAKVAAQDFESGLAAPAGAGDRAPRGAARVLGRGGARRVRSS